jgi:hypothetical protein
MNAPNSVRPLRVHRTYTTAARFRVHTHGFESPIAEPARLRLKAPPVTGTGKMIDKLIVTPGMHSQAIEFLGREFTQLSGEVFGILAYIDLSTLELLRKIPLGDSIRLLTSATGGDSDKISFAVTETKKTRPGGIQIIQLTVVNNSNERPLFHERWITDKIIMIDIGTDLKMSSIGSKQHTITVYDAHAYRDRIANFEKWWRCSEAELSIEFSSNLRKRLL